MKKPKAMFTAGEANTIARLREKGCAVVVIPPSYLENWHQLRQDIEDAMQREADSVLDDAFGTTIVDATKGGDQ